MIPLLLLAHVWTFPSDHLPIYSTCGDHTFVSFNVLSKENIDRIYDKGLGGSRLEATCREPALAGHINAILDEGVDFLALQEVDPPLHSFLPTEAILYSETGEVLIYDEEKFLLLDVAYGPHLIDALFEERITGNQIRILNQEDGLNIVSR